MGLAFLRILELLLHLTYQIQWKREKRVKEKWERKDLFGLIVLPLELLIGNNLIRLPFFKENPFYFLIGGISVNILAFVVLLMLYKSTLKKQWQQYRQHLWRNLLLALVLVVISHLLIQFIRGALPENLIKIPTDTADSGILQTDFKENRQLVALFLAALPSFIAPFSEELVFRYLLVGKAPNHFIRGTMLFIQAILFGLIHYANFNGNLYATIPYMTVGFFFGLIYLVYRNIWGSLMVHWIFNMVNQMIPTLFIIVLTLLGIAN